MKQHAKLLEFKKFALGLEKKDKIAVVYDSDPDGLSAAVIVSKAIQRLRGKKPELVFFQQQSIVSLQESTIQKLKKHKINKLIILDLAVDQDAKQIKKAEKFAHLLVLDHHKTYKNISSKKTVFLKSNDFSFLDPSKYATAKLSFDLFAEVADIGDLKWLACVGLTGDYCISIWKNFCKTMFKETGFTQKGIQSVVKLISSVETVNRKQIAALYKELLRAKRPQDSEHSKYGHYKKLVEKELKILLAEFAKKKEIFAKQELVFFAFKSKYDIKSILVNRISTEIYPNKTVVLAEEKGKNIVTLSARKELKDAMAGGHIPAAGGKIEKKDLEKFKQNVIRILSE
ncbi:MAG: DHH family phosphoesterase [Candidatus Diapherotrites archaeon]|nr:DHH family phosphoesterase [Candidatus Diapherotrites archaeon]